MLSKFCNEILVVILQLKGSVLFQTFPLDPATHCQKKLIMMVFTVVHLMSETMLLFSKCHFNKPWHFSRAFCENEQFYFDCLIIVHNFCCKLKI